MDSIIALGAALGLYLNAKYSIGSDIAQLRGARKIQKYSLDLFAKYREDDWSFYHIVHASHAVRDTLGHGEALRFEDRSWTHNEFRQEIGRMAERLASLGIGNRTVVCLLINNSPEFLFAWWALFKLGAIPAPINTKFRREHIRHCARICGASFIISTAELWEVVRETYFESPDEGRQPTAIIYDYGTYPAVSLPDTVIYLNHDLFPPATSTTDDFPREARPQMSSIDPAQYLFTSGTTGLPKAVCYPTGFCHLTACHDRWPGMYKTRRRFYICLPMFHGTAQVAAMPATLTTFGTIILARRFSRREFWSDCRRHGANAILYIGEMMRYLVQSPPDARFPNEKDHGVELAFGLGLAPTVWKTFRERFGVDWIVEYYSSTESTVSLVNSTFNDAGVGKVAHWGPLMRWLGSDSFRLIKTDLETGEVLRDPRTGFCIPAKIGEVGESICRIRPPIQRKHDYVGEGGEGATEKKTLRDVFERGDEFFRLGDALTIDADGYISFSDRLGDTYRVKGHNISTTEVENCLSRHPAITSVNVYAIPMNRYGYEGQLGCAAIELDSASQSEAKTIASLEQWMVESDHGIPSYAVPRFLRVHDRLEKGERVSAVMKKVKTGLRKEGFTPEGGDRMYWIEKEGGGYVPLTRSAVELLQSGRFNL